MEIKVVSGTGMCRVMEELLPDFERTSGYNVAISFSPAKMILDRLEAGEAADFAILGASAIDELEQKGKIAPGTRRDLGRYGVGVAVRAGTPKPDVSSIEALKRTLLSAKSVSYTEQGVSGIYFARLLERLGIAAQIKAKSKTSPGGLVGELAASGEVELAIQQIPELMAVPGIELVGPLPDEVQLISVATAAIFTDARNSRGAQALLEYLSTTAAARVLKAKGYESCA